MRNSTSTSIRAAHIKAQSARSITRNGTMVLSRIGGGHIVFCNPPYGRQIGEWVRKAYQESLKPETVVVMLIPARTDTSYYHDYIFHNKADEIWFIRGRLHFEDEDGNRKDPAPFPSAVIVYRYNRKHKESAVYAR